MGEKRKNDDPTWWAQFFKWLGEQDLFELILYMSIAMPIVNSISGYNRLKIV